MQRWCGQVEEVEAGVAELEDVAVFDRCVGEGRVGVFAEIDAGAGALGELVMARDEVDGVRLDDVLSLLDFPGRSRGRCRRRAGGR